MAQYEEKIKDLLEQMTLEEKVGQLQQCGPSLVGAFEVSFSELLDMMFDGKISEAEFGRLMSTAQEDFHEEDLRAGKIGSYNGIKNAATANKLQKIAVEETRLGIPLIFGYDVIHGYRTIIYQYFLQISHLAILLFGKRQHVLQQRKQLQQEFI